MSFDSDSPDVVGLLPLLPLADADDVEALEDEDEPLPKKDICEVTVSL